MKDNFAIFTSGLCLIHCLAAPLLLIAGLSGAFINWFEAEWIHQALLVPVVALAVLSLPHAYKQHGSLVPLLLAGVGIITMSSSFYLPESLELWLVIPSALLIISAHGMNKRLLASTAI
jgi:hypothetical protein